MSGDEFEEREEGWATNIAEHTSLSIFCDEFTEIAELAAGLPYGVLSLLVLALEDIKKGMDEDITPSDWHLYEKMYYFVAGILLTKQDKDLLVTDNDLNILSEIFEYMSIKISLVEGHLGGYLEAKYDNTEGCWSYKVPEMFKDQLVTFLEKDRKPMKS